MSGAVEGLDPRVSAPVAAGAGGPAPYPRWGLGAFFLGVGLFVVAEVVSVFIGGALKDLPEAAELLGLVLVWAAFLGAIAFATLHGGRRSVVADFGLRFRWWDLLIGIVAGLVLTVIASQLERLIITLVGGAGFSNLPSSSEPTAWFVVNGILGAAIVAPFVEELFFRGLLLRAIGNLVRGGRHRLRGRDWDASLQEASRGRRIAAAVVSVAITSIVFTMFHMLEANNAADLLLLAAATLPLGIVNGIFAYRTGRLGPGIVTHITFNAMALLH